MGTAWTEDPTGRAGSAGAKREEGAGATGSEAYDRPGDQRRSGANDRPGPTGGMPKRSAMGAPGAAAEAVAAGAAGAEGDHGGELAGVVGAGSGGVAAVVGGQEQPVVVPQLGHDLGEAGVEALQAAREGLQGAGVALGVAAVAVDHVEVDQVGEDEGRAVGPAQEPDGGVQGGLVVAGVVGAGQAPAGEDVLALAASARA